MKDISEIRRENVKRLINERAMTRTDFAEKIGMLYSQLANYIGENPKKNIGKVVARRIETAFELSENWLDQDWSINQQPNNGIVVNGNNTNHGTQIGTQQALAQDGQAVSSGISVPLSDDYQHAVQSLASIANITPSEWVGRLIEKELLTIREQAKFALQATEGLGDK